MTRPTLPPAEDLLAAVRVVARGDALPDPAITRSVVERFTDLPAPRADLAAKLAI